MRQRILGELPSPLGQLPMRTLVGLGGNATWGELEAFSHQPTVGEEDIAASRPLRDWYRRYSGDFDVFFPEQHTIGLPKRADWSDSDHSQLPQQLQRLAGNFAAATGRFADSALTLGVLLRDHAEALAPVAEWLDFSVDSLVRELLLSDAPGAPAEAVYSQYEELLEQLPAEPATMFIAFGLTRGSPTMGRWKPIDLFAAVAGAEESAGALRQHSFQKHANSDLPTASDELGIEPLVEGLRALLDDKRTDPSLSIGITAPWGGGKSSLMFQLRRALETPHPDRHRTWIPIRFDAWKFERSERIWAALSRAIYEQSQMRMNTRERLRFKVSLEYLRQGRLRFWAGPAVVVALALAAVALLVLHSSALPGLVTLLVAALGAGAILSRLWGFLSDPFKRALDGYTSNPHYEEQLGFTTEADADIQRLTQLLTRDKDHVLVVFVDDLDRCSPAHLVETVEAINQIFNAAAYEPDAAANADADEDLKAGRCVFVLGMDRDMVAAGIEVAYAETIKKLPPVRRKNFGLKFLAKIVQLSVAVPRPDAAAIERLLDAIGGPVALDSPAAERHEPALTPEGALAVDKQGPAAPTAPAPTAGGSDASSEPLPFDEDSEEFRRAEREAVHYLEPNPRDVKRFDNAFRLQLHVAARTPGCKLQFNGDDLTAMAKWVAMRLRWPELADAIDADSELLGRLEAFSHGDSRPYDGEGQGIVLFRERSWIKDDGLIALIRYEQPSCRISRLQKQVFLRVS